MPYFQSPISRVSGCNINTGDQSAAANVFQSPISRVSGCNCVIQQGLDPVYFDFQSPISRVSGCNVEKTGKDAGKVEALSVPYKSGQWL